MVLYVFGNFSMAPGGDEYSSERVFRFWHGWMEGVRFGMEGTEYGALQDSCGYVLELLLDYNVPGGVGV